MADATPEFGSWATLDVLFRTGHPGWPRDETPAWHLPLSVFQASYCKFLTDPQIIVCRKPLNGVNLAVISYSFCLPPLIFCLVVISEGPHTLQPSTVADCCRDQS